MFILSLFMYDFLAFDGVDPDAQKIQLELYFDEPKHLEKNTRHLTSFHFGKEMNFVILK
jgi:hypothetical protein